jgi:hypothetical protein
MTLLRAMPGSCEDIHTVSLPDPAALWHPCRRQNVSPLRNSVKVAGPLVDAGSIRRRNKGRFYSGSIYRYGRSEYLGELNPGNSQNQTSAQFLKKQRTWTVDHASMLQHYFWSVDPQRLVRPFETLGTATSRQTLRDFKNRNISSDPSRLWEPQRLVRPFETLGTTTSRQTLRNSGNRKRLVGPYETLGTATSRQTLRDSGNRTPHRPKKGFGQCFEHRKRLRPLGPEPFRARSC